jgi:trigger factor
MSTDVANKVSVSDAGPSRKKVSIEVPAQTVSSSLGLTLDTLLLEAELPGFRKGRAPRRLIEKRFGAAIGKQAKESLVAQAFSKAVEDHKLRVLGSPFARDLDKIELVAGKPFAFEVEVEVLPEFDLPKMDAINIRKPLIEVADAMVDDEVKKLTIQEGSLEERQSPEAGDYLTGHATMAGPDGKVYFESDGIVVQLPPADKAPKGMIVGLVVEDLSAQLGTPKVGQASVVKTTGPANHENEAIRGLALTVTYTPARIDRILPARVSDLVARFGMEDEAALKGAIRERIEARVKIEQISAMRSQVAKYLLEETRMDLPQRVTSEQAQRNLERRRMELLYRGVDAVQIEQHIAELRSASTIDAVRDLKLFFVIDKASAELGVSVSEQEVMGRVAQMAAERGTRPEQLRNELLQSGQMNMVWGQIREHKTMDAIIAKCKVTELPLAEYNQLVESENKAGAEAAKAKKK